MIKYILIFLIAASSLKAQWIQSTGIPPNQIIYSFAQSNGKMYAGIGSGILTSGALYVSTDNGATWVNSTLQWQGLSAVMTLAVKDNYIYAGTYEDDLFISSDAGANWSHIILNNSAGVFQVGTSGNNVVAYTNGTGPAWISANQGANWSVTGTNVLAQVNDFISIGNKFFASAKNGLAVSTNDGLTWTLSTGNGLPSNPDGSRPITALVYHNGKIYANCINKILYTTDNGENWNPTNYTFSTFSYTYSMISYGGRIFAGLTGQNDTSRGVLVTPNNGTNWSLMNNGLSASPNVRKLMINNEYMLAGVNQQGIFRIPVSALTGIENQITSANNFSLQQNYPNPFNPETNINFTLNKKGFTTLKVYNASGRLVSILVSDELNEGYHSYPFNGNNLSSGIYFYKLESGEFSETKRMILVK